MAAGLPLQIKRLKEPENFHGRASLRLERRCGIPANLK